MAFNYGAVKTGLNNIYIVNRIITENYNTEPI